MPHSRTVIATPHAGRYLRQLCRHWAHRFETEAGETEARIALPLGVTRLSAGPEALTVEVTACEAADLPELRDVVARHIERFAFRETLRIDWT